MVNSMTGFAALKGAEGATRWGWEIRGVNGRGLDLRLRLPEGLDTIEVLVRKGLTSALSRGSITLNLRLQAGSGVAVAALDLGQLGRVLAALKVVENSAQDHGLHLTASTAADILALRGVLDGSDSSETAQQALLAALKAQIAPLIADFCAARAAEGQALHGILSGQLREIEALLAAARAALGDRFERMRESLGANLARVLENSDGADPDRVAQELAILAVKADVAEELDRIKAHIAAAKVLLASEGAIGRKFDFLMQEFNREANTLCAKSGSADLTRIALDLKTVIDQMREQVQNVE